MPLLRIEEVESAFQFHVIPASGWRSIPSGFSLTGKKLNQGSKQELKKEKTNDGYRIFGL